MADGTCFNVMYSVYLPEAVTAGWDVEVDSDGCAEGVDLHEDGSMTIEHCYKAVEFDEPISIDEAVTKLQNAWGSDAPVSVQVYSVERVEATRLMILRAIELARNLTEAEGQEFTHLKKLIAEKDWTTDTLYPTLSEESQCSM